MNTLIGKKNLVCLGCLKSLSFLTKILITVSLTTSLWAKTDLPKVEIQTSYGNIEVTLYPHKAPVTVKNFLNYVKSDFYKDTIFHRVIGSFMIQGGGLTKDLQKKPTQAPIKLESKNGLSNERYTIAMARTNNPKSATSQFFINVENNQRLDFQSDTNPGYAVFGKVTKGFSVINKVKMVKTTTQKGRANVPVKPILIKAVNLL